MEKKFIQEIKVIFLNFGNPNHIYEFPEIDSMILAYNNSLVNQKNIIHVLTK